MNKKVVIKNNTDFLHNLILIIIAAFLFILSHPNFIFAKGLGFFAWIYYVPVLIAIDSSRSIKECLWLGFIYGILILSGYGYWLCNSYLMGFFAIIISYGVILSFVFVLLMISSKLFENNGWFVQAFILSAYEYIKTLGFLGFSYCDSAYTQWKNLYFIQIAKLIGNFGVGTILIFSSAVIFAFIKKIYLRKKNQFSHISNRYQSGENLKRFIESEKIDRQLSLRFPIICLVILILCVSASYVCGFMILRKSPEINKQITVCAIQSNDDPKSTGFDAYKKSVKVLMKLTDEALEIHPEIDMVIWPETAVVPAIVYYFKNDSDKRRHDLSVELLKYIDSKNCQFVIGNGHKVSDRQKSSTYNSALVFNPGENVYPPEPAIYSKNHLVPFSEYFPLTESMPGFYRFLVKRGHQMWSPGNSVEVFNYGDFKYSTPICFEDTFSDVCRKMAKSGAKAFINLTNDSWSKSEACQNQHLAMAVFRSVENDIPSLRCTTDGVTCLIDKNGFVTQKIDGFCASYLVGQIDVLSAEHNQTLYTGIGDVLPLVEIVILLFMLIIRLILVKIRK